MKTFIFPKKAFVYIVLGFLLLHATCKKEADE